MFVHLHNHSDYSLQKSVSTVEAIVKRAKELQQPAIAISDNGNLFATVEFAKICQEEKIKAIYACEFNLVQDIETKIKFETGSILLLCMNDTGFSNLKKLSSIAYVQGFYYQPRIDYQILSTHNEGLLAIIPQNNSLLSHYLEIGKSEQVTQEITRLQGIFSDRLYFEVQNHGLALEYQLNEKIAALNKEWNIPLVAGNNCHYISQEDSHLHDIFMNIETKVRNKLSLANDQFYIKNYDEMKSALKAFPEAVANTLLVANRCEFEFTFREPELPSFTLPSNFTNEDEYLRHLTWEGIKTHYKTISEEITKRADYELEVITSMQYSGYFLIMWDIIAFANKSDIPVGLGRGSVAGSIVAYALGLTEIDPLKFGLLFERFLNPERVSMPDIDTDFCMARRQEIIEYIKQKYGASHVGQIITFSQLKPRGAIRDVARALHISLETADEIAKLIPPTCKSLAEAEAQEPKLKSYHKQQYKALFDITEKLIGLHRHASLHAAGIVIGTKELTEYVPLYRDIKSGAIATQFTMNYLEPCGLVKMDILGLRTLTIVRNTEKSINKEEPDFSIKNIPEHDEGVFAMLRKGEGDSVFQFESPGMKRLLKETKPKNLEDLIALNALYRPGPMRFIDDYTKVRTGKAKPDYGHTVLKPILADTNGFILYQEQVMDIGRRVGGFSLARADILRRNMGKKEAKAMEEQRPVFVEGAITQGFSKKEADAIFDKLAPFARYGFNKSHSAAYATLAYQTAYLKVHYPLHYMISCINANCNKQEEVTKQLLLCKKLGIEILAPDINRSQYGFSIENGKVRYGFNAIKDMSDELKHHIPKEREENGNFTSILNFFERLPLLYKSLLNFVKIAISVGLLDSIDNRKALLYANAHNIYNESRKRALAKRDKQILLFTDESDYSNTLTNFDDIPQEDLDKIQAQIIQEERNYLGIHLTQNPVEPYKALWSELTTIDISNPKRYLHKHNIDNPLTVVAYIDDFTRLVDIKRNQKTFIGTFEDYNGSIPFTLYADINDDTIELKKREMYGIMGFVKLILKQSEIGFVITKVLSPQGLAEEVAAIKKRIFETTPYREIHIYLAKQVSQPALLELKETLLHYYGETKILVYAHTSNNDLKKIALAPGFTVDAKHKELVEYLHNSPNVAKFEQF